MWWTYTELMETGRLTKTITLEKGKGALKSGKVGGQLKVELILPRFSDKLEQRGDLSELFPLMPSDESVSMKAKINFACSEKSSEDISKLKQIPGMLFLLKKRLYLHAFTRKEQVKIEYGYEDIENTDEDSESENGNGGTIIISLKDRKRLIISGLLDAEGVLSTIKYHIGSYVSEESLTLMNRIKDANEELVSKPEAPGTLFLKVYIADYKELKCEQGYTLSLTLKETFKKAAEKLLKEAGVSPKESSMKKHRFFTVPPATRWEFCDVQKIDSKMTAGEALAAGLVTCGAAVTFRDYDKKTKARLKNKARLAGEAATVFVNVVYCVNAQTKFEPVAFELNRKKTFKETMVIPICKKHGISSKGVRLFLCSYSSDYPNRTIDVEIPMTSTPAEEFITDNDLLAVKVKPTFHNRVDKFGEYDERYEIYSLLCHCYMDPLHPKPRDKTILPHIALTYNLAGERCAELENAAAEHAKYGAESVLLELEDRLAQSRFHTYYTQESFATQEIYQRWMQEQRAAVAALMRTVVFDGAPFAAELFVGIVKGKDFPPTDETNLIDPFVTVIYKTQRRSTEVAHLSLNPKWDASLYFNITSLDSPLIFYVFNYGHRSEDSSSMSASPEYDASTTNGEEESKSHKRGAPELIGTAQVNLREQMALLDGDKHELIIKLNNAKRKGSLTITLHCFYETMDYVNRTRTMELSTRPNTPYKLQVKKYYDTLYETLGEAKSIEDDRPWILREFGARYCVSDIYCNAIKLRDLLASGAAFSPHMSKAISRTTLCLARPTVVPNADEAEISDAALRELFAKSAKEFLPLCFSTTDSAIELTEPLVSALAEVVEQESSYGDLYKMLSSAVTRGVNKQYAAINQSKVFDNAAEVTKCPSVKNTVQTFGLCLSDEYIDLFNKIVTQIKIAIPHDLQDSILGDFVDCLNDIVNDSLSRVSILITSVVDEDTKEEPARERRYAEIDAAISPSKSKSKSKSRSKGSSRSHKDDDDDDDDESASRGGIVITVPDNVDGGNADDKKRGKKSLFGRIRRKSTELVKRRGSDAESDSESTTPRNRRRRRDTDDISDSEDNGNDDKKKKGSRKGSKKSGGKSSSRHSKKKRSGKEEDAGGDDDNDGDESEYDNVDVPLTDLVHDLITTVAQFKAHVEENSGQVLEITHYTGLMMIWLKNTGERFRAAIKRFVENDPRERFGGKAHYSRSIAEVEEYCNGAIELLKQIQVYDPFVWSQVTELVMSSLLYYFGEESRIAIEKLNQKDDDDTDTNSLARATARSDGTGMTGAAQLVELSISISNIEKGQKIFDMFINWIEETTDKWKDSMLKRDIAIEDDEYEDEDEDEDREAYNERVSVSLEAVNAAITNAAKEYKRCIIDPLREVGRLSSIHAKDILEAGVQAPEKVAGLLTEHYDGYVCRIKECISKKIFGHALEELWNSFITTFWEVIRPENPLQNNGGGLTKTKVATAYTSILADVVAYFGTDESRLAASILERGEAYLRVKQMLGLYTLDSATLITYFKNLTHRPPLPLSDELYSSANPNYILFILKNRFDDKAAQEFFRSDEASNDSERIRQTLGLPMTEIILKKWRCNYNNKVGSAYLSSSYFIFVNDDGNAIKIALADVSSVAISKVLLFFKGLTIQIYNQTYNFSKFEGEPIEDILPIVKVQCALAGNVRI